MWKHIHVIANPASGTESALLFPLNSVLRQAKIQWDMSVTHKKGDAFRAAQLALSREVEAVAVYGGDGTIMEVAQALLGSKLPIVILPGGSANVLAKEFQLPLMLPDALRIFLREPELKHVDMGVCNDHPFLIRLNLGFLAEIVTNASRKQKNQYGNFAYALSALGTVVQEPNLSTYTIITEEKTRAVTGIGLMVANSGNIGIPGVSLLPNMHIDDGLLDIYVVQKADLTFLLSLTSSAMNAPVFPKALKHWQVSEATISCDPSQTTVLDDVQIKPSTMHLSVQSKSLIIAT